MGCREHAGFPDAELALALVHVFAEEKMKFVRRHGALEFRPLDCLAHKRVGIEQHVVVEKHVVNADDALAPQLHIVERGRA